MKSARKQLKKSTSDFDRTDGSADDGEAAEVAEGCDVMVVGGWSHAFALGGFYDGGKGRCRLDAAMVAIVHRCTVCTTVRDPHQRKDGTSHGSPFLILAPSDYHQDNLHIKSLGVAI
jgi:hypothetical protein